MLIENDCDIVKPGYCLKDKSGQFHLVLDVIENDHVQNPWGGTWSYQSRNEPKERIFRVWDGKFLNNKSQKECERLYVEILEPDDLNLLEMFNTINNNWK